MRWGRRTGAISSHYDERERERDEIRVTEGSVGTGNSRGRAEVCRSMVVWIEERE